MPLNWSTYDSPAPKFDLDREIASAARGAGVDPELFRSLIMHESGGDPNAIGDGGQAVGPGQLHGAAAADMGLSSSDRYDPVKNLQASAGYLKQNIDAAGGDTRLGLAMYNQGAAGMRTGGADVQRKGFGYADDVLRGSGRGRPRESAGLDWSTYDKGDSGGGLDWSTFDAAAKPRADGEEKEPVQNLIDRTFAPLSSKTLMGEWGGETGKVGEVGLRAGNFVMGATPAFIAQLAEDVGGLSTKAGNEIAEIGTEIHKALADVALTLLPGGRPALTAGKAAVATAGKMVAETPGWVAPGLLVTGHPQAAALLYGMRRLVLWLEKRGMMKEAAEVERATAADPIKAATEALAPEKAYRTQAERTSPFAQPSQRMPEAPVD